jgi:DNA segregation ATPase FtsK/SpoIIIE-like protein
VANANKKSKDKNTNTSSNRSNGKADGRESRDLKERRDNTKKSGGNAVKNRDSGSGVAVKESHGSREIIAVILAAVGVFIIFSLFGKTGQIGRLVVSVMFGLVGRFATIVLLIMLFVLAFTVLRGTSKTIFSLKNVILFVLMLLISAAMIHTFAYNVEHYEGRNFLGIVSLLWKEQEHGGGVIGGLISYGLQRLVEKPGALIILIPATIVLAMVLFSLSFVRAAKKIANAGGKFGGWMSGVVERFKKSDEKNKEKKRIAAAEKAWKKELKAQEAKEAEERKAEEKRLEAEARARAEAEHNEELLKGEDGETYDDGYGYSDGTIPADAGDGAGISDEHIELVSARGRKKDVFREDLEKQKERHREAERKIMSQEDDDAEGYRPFSGQERAANAAVAPAGAAASQAAGAVRNDDRQQATGGNVQAIGGNAENASGTLQQGPSPAAVNKPAKVENEIRVVLCNEDAIYKLPPHDILRSVDQDFSDALEQEKNAKLTARKLEDVMRSFGIEAKVTKISIGSTVTMFELQPQSGVKVSRIKNLSDDIALNLAASGVRILAPIPGKAAIGIEVPNEDRRTVYLKDLIETTDFENHRSKLAFCLGEDISGAPIIADIAKMPHVLIAGTTGSGKSVCINCLIMSLLYRCTPNDVRLIMIDPKVVELQIYNSIPHLLIPVVTEPKKAAGALSWTVQEMENRYKLFAKYNLRDINAYNDYAPEHGLPRMPRIVIIIDELADLMMVVRDSAEEAINRIAQKARAAGMHLIVATQRPSVDVITGLIKANIPSRIAFTVSSVVDSKTILDYGGAEKLLGRGDMLYHPLDFMKPLRVQGGFVSDMEIEETVDFLRVQRLQTELDEQISSDIDNARPVEKPGRGNRVDIDANDADPMLPEAIDIAIETKQISASFLQRKLGLGYSRASRLIDQMEERGYISARDGNNPRQVLVSQNPLR